MLYVVISMYMHIGKIPSFTKVMFVLMFNILSVGCSLLKKIILLTQPVENSSVCLCWEHMFNGRYRCPNIVGFQS